jgi:hypothetical protein
MKKRWAFRLAVGITGLTLISLLPLPRVMLLGCLRRESFYKGRPTSYWSGVVKRWSEYVKTLRVKGGGGVRTRQPPAPPPPPPTVFDRLEALIGRLTQDDFDPPDWESDPAAIPVLLELLSDPDAEVRKYAARTFVHMGPMGEAALPKLTDLLRDDVPEVRSLAAGALASVERRKERAVPLLVGMLKDPEPLVRRRIANLLGEFGESEEVVPALKEALNDEDKQVRVEAAAALERIEQGRQ